MKLLVVTLSTVVIAFLSCNIATNTARAENMSIKCHDVSAGIKFYRESAWHLQDKLNLSRTKVSNTEIRSCKYGRWVASLWRHRSRKLFVAWRNRVTIIYPAHNSLWECIHEGEGAWNNHGGGYNHAYYGGLQMHYEWGYGINTYAYLLSPLEQKWAAERGYIASNFSHAWLWGQWGADEGRCWQYA